MRSGPRPGHQAAGHVRAPYACIALISGAALALEVLLLRLFSIVHWHHSAHLAISLALLGFGLSGSVLFLLQQRWLQRWQGLLRSTAVAFALAVPGCVLLAQSVPFNALSLLWEPRQWLFLAAIYLLLMLPFFFAACCIGLSFRVCAAQIPRLYAADLLGAGAGCMLVIAALSAAPPSRLLWLCSAVGMLAAAAVPGGRRAVRAGLLVLGALLALAPAGWLPLQQSEHKSLSRLLQVPGTEVIRRASSAQAEISVVRSATVPLRVAPGLSLMAEAGPPEQLALVFDRDRVEVVDRYAPQQGSLDYLAWLSSAAAYALPRWERAPPAVLIAGLSSRAVLQAHAREAGSILVAEPDARLIELYRGPLADFSGWRATGARIVRGDTRSLLLRPGPPFDLIVLPQTGAGTGTLSGATAAGEAFLLSREALTRAWERLGERGVLSATLRLQVPPRASLRLLATCAEVLRRAGIDEPGRHLAVLRSWETVTLLLSRPPLDADAVEALRRFAAARAFDLAWLPGLAPAETNRHNRLQAAWLYDGARRILADDAQGLYQDYKFAIRPVSDASPYFYQFLKPALLPELLDKRHGGALALVETAYPILWLSLAQAVVLSLILILLPLRLLPRARRPAGFGRALLYFVAIGLGFLFIEIAFLQRFTLYLGHPVTASALVLAVFLVSAGAGSAWAARLPPARGSLALVGGAVAALAGAWALGAGPVHGPLAGLDTMPRMALLAALTAPLGFAMGMPFVLGMARLRQLGPDVIPWAWGVNGCASVIAAVLAPIVLIHGGFVVLLGVAAGLYLLLPVLRP